MKEKIINNWPLVLILAGGCSERFWPLEEKNLLPFLGKSLLFHQVEKIKKAGFDKIVIVCNFSLFSKLKKSKNKLGAELVLQKGKGQAAAIFSAKEFIKKGAVLVVNANDLFEEKLLQEIERKSREDNLDGLLVGYQIKNYFPGGYLVVKDEFVKEVVEKPGEGKEPSDLVRLVVDYFKDGEDLLAFIQKCGGPFDKIYESALTALVNKKRFKVVRYDGFWGYLKYPWDTLFVMDLFLKTINDVKIAKTAQIAKSATISGNVLIEEGVKVLEGAKIVGPSFIGGETVVGNNVLIRESMIGKNCVVGFGTEIARSYIGGSCWFHTNYVGDSILADNVSMGAGAVLANLRLDGMEIKSVVKGEKLGTGRTKLGTIAGNNVRIGVNASVMPGVKIGKNSYVGSEVVLSSDLPEGKCCFLKQEYVIKNNIAVFSKEERKNFKEKLKY